MQSYFVWCLRQVSSVLGCSDVTIGWGVRYGYTPIYWLGSPVLGCVGICVGVVVRLLGDGANCTSSRFHQPRVYRRRVAWLRIVISRDLFVDGGRTVPTIPYSSRRVFVIRTMSPGRWGLSHRLGFAALAWRILGMILSSAWLVSSTTRSASSLLSRSLSSCRVKSSMLSSHISRWSTMDEA